VIDGNQALNGGTGIKVTGVRNLIIRNMVGNNSPNYDIAAGNRYGPIVDLTTGPTAPLVNGNLKSSVTNTTCHKPGPGIFLHSLGKESETLARPQILG
jgi:hypothetical protein